MLLSISVVVGRWGAFGKQDMDRTTIQEKLKYVLNWLKGIDVFYVSYWSIVIDYVFLYSYFLLAVYQVFSCVSLMRLRLSNSYDFIWKSFWRLWYVLWKFLILHYFSLCICDEWYVRACTRPQRGQVRRLQSEIDPNF